MTTVPLGHLYLVATPKLDQPEAEFLARVEAALDGGVDTLQLRCKDWEALPYIRLGAKVSAMSRARNVPLFINDRVDVALACGAEGVHLGQGDLPLSWARQLAPDLAVGRSTHAPEQALEAVREQPSYVAAGPVYATPTKPGRPAVGLDYVRWAAHHLNTVWYAIGGIDASTLPAVLEAGARRVAVVRAVLDASDPAATAHEFRRQLDTHSRQEANHAG